MVDRTQSGFILPLALVISSGLLVIAVMAWQWEISSLPREQAIQLNKRARTTLLLNVPGLLRSLEEEILLNPATSALVRSTDAESQFHRSVLLDPDSGDSMALHSENETASNKVTVFHSPVSGADLAADLIDLDLPGALVKQSLAWTAEDLNLMAPESAPPEFWPLPAWDLAPVGNIVPIEAFLDEATRGSWRSLEWVPAGDPLSMSEQSSPALVPVVRSLGVRFGIFAAGSSRSREKTIRVRFFIEGELWNPYNRTLAIHPGSGQRSVLRVLFWNLPEVCLHNRSLGLSSGWIPLDSARNSRSGSSGLHGYVRLPGTLAPGESRTFLEPDPARQPQGLARTLHPGFMVRPADQIEIEFRQPPGGLHAACLPLDISDPLDNALDGEGWFRLEAFPAEWPRLRFARADAGPKPFLLENGSLSFRLENAHIRTLFTNRVTNFPYMRDPRRARVVFDESLQTPSGEWSTGADLYSLEIERLEGPVEQIPPAGSLALFSWPEAAPQSVVAAMDLPQWWEGFRLGSPNATVLNRLLNDPELPLNSSSNEEPVQLQSTSGPTLDYHRSFPVNQVSESAWIQRLAKSGLPNESNSLSFAAQIDPDHTVSSDFRSWPVDTLQSAVRAWTGSIRLAPLKSPAALFNSGLMGQNIPAVREDDPLHPFLALRGWLSKTPLPRAHGAAWILHITSQANRDSLTQWVSARLWLLETRSPEGHPSFEVIRFEWTDPESLRMINPR